jgi:type I restriction enzyme S subunit
MRRKKQSLDLDESPEQTLMQEGAQPYEVPRNWIWTSVGSINRFTSSSINPLNYANDLFELYSVPSSENNYPEILRGSEIGSSKQVVSKNDVLICKINPRINRVWIVSSHTENIQIASSEWIVFRNFFTNSKYLMYYFSSKTFREYMLSNVSGVGGSLMRAQPKYIKDYPIPIPPIAEQQRIVDLIEGLIEKLDQAKGLIKDALDSIENRKAAILNKAFKGELTRNWREENETDSTDKIISSILNERGVFINPTKSVQQYINNEDFRDDIDSNGWIAMRTMIFCDNITCGGTPTGFLSESGEVPFLKVYNIVNNKIDFIYKPQFVDINVHKSKLKNSILRRNDVVMNIVGPPLRKIAIIPDTYDEWNMNQAIIRFRAVDYIDPKYLYYALLNPQTLEPVIQSTKGVVGQANISITQARNIKIPIASKQEQIEIVRILDNVLNNEDEALRLMDQLEVIDQIKKAILARAFCGDLGTNNPLEESAREVLKTKV